MSFAVRAPHESYRSRPFGRKRVVYVKDLHTTMTAAPVRAVAGIVESDATTSSRSLRCNEANRRWCDHSILLAGVLRSPASSLPVRRESARRSEILHDARRNIFPGELLPSHDECDAQSYERRLVTTRNRKPSARNI